MFIRCTSRHLGLNLASKALLAIVVVAGVLSLAQHAYAKGYSLEEDETPALCPSGSLVGFASSQYHVRKWGQPAGAEVLFTVSTYSYIEQYHTMFGFGWYQPAPVTTTTSEGEWQWIADGGPPAVRAQCTKRTLFGMEFHFIRLTGAYIGVAWPSWLLGVPGTEQTDVRPGGSTGEGMECWELVMYGYDEYGHYWEVVLEEWCFPVNQS